MTDTTVNWHGIVFQEAAVLMSCSVDELYDLSDINLLDLGFTSLSLVQLHFRLRERGAEKLEVTALAEYATLDALADHLVEVAC